jgi:DNA-binding NtrC family response regulator
MFDAPTTSPLAGMLVVDNDSDALRLLTQTLRAEGFRVWSASSAQEAIQLYTQHREEIDVVLLEVHLPSLDGPATLNQLRDVQPDLVCWFMADHLGEYSEVTLRQRGAVGVLAKPLQLGDLVRLLREQPVASRQKTQAAVSG